MATSKELWLARERVGNDITCHEPTDTHTCNDLYTTKVHSLI